MRRKPRRDPWDPVALAATLACILEASAGKVGNVTPSQRFADVGFEDFVSSAVAMGPAIGHARPGRVGWAIYQAVVATKRVTRTNTNLGMALLFAPIVAAWRSRGRRPLRRRLASVLRGLTVTDARWTYRAIRIARPGGLGRSRRGDVRRSPALTLAEAMALAAERDSIAGEYVHEFRVTFEIALRALRRAVSGGLSILDSIVHAHLELLARVPDTLIARKAGARAARTVATKARAVVLAGGLHTQRGQAAIRRFDRYLRRDGNRLNPGTSADLIAAAVFVWLLESAPGRGIA